MSVNIPVFKKIWREGTRIYGELVGSGKIILLKS